MGLRSGWYDAQIYVSWVTVKEGRKTYNEVLVQLLSLLLLRPLEPVHLDLVGDTERYTNHVSNPSDLPTYEHTDHPDTSRP